MKKFQKQSKYYNNKLLYKNHYQLKMINEGISNNSYKLVKNNLIFFGILMFLNLINQQYGKRILPEYYPETLLSIEVSILSMHLFYRFVLKRLIYKGKITAYFKRDYSSMGKSMVFIGKLIYGAIFRSAIVMSFFMLYALMGDYSIKEALFKLQDIFNPTIIIPMFIFGIVSMYIVFYQGSYVSIKNYSNRMIKKRKEGKNEKEAFLNLVREIDNELGIRAYDGSYYDVERRGRTKVEKEMGIDLELDLDFLNTN